MEYKNCKPFLKWAGGKSQTLKDIMYLFPKKINNYREIFLGGGSVLIELLKMLHLNKIEIKNKIYCYDINKNLIITYNVIKYDVKNFLNKIKKLKDKYNNIKM